MISVCSFRSSDRFQSPLIPPGHSPILDIFLSAVYPIPSSTTLLSVVLALFSMVSQVAWTVILLLECQGIFLNETCSLGAKCYGTGKGSV